jgi:hypothetical protein
MNTGIEEHNQNARLILALYEAKISLGPNNTRFVSIPPNTLRKFLREEDFLHWELSTSTYPPVIYSSRTQP